MYVKYGKISHLISGGPLRNVVSGSPEAETEHKDRTASWTTELAIHVMVCHEQRWGKTDNFKYDSKSKIVK